MPPAGLHACDGLCRVQSAAQRGDTTAVAALLARADLPREVANRALLTAVEHNQPGVVRAMVMAGDKVDVNAPRPTGFTPLMCAADKGHVAVLRALLAAPGISVNHSTDGLTALYVAAVLGRDACVRALLAGGADPNRVDANRATPLMMAAWKGHAGCVAALVAWPGVGLNTADASGRTATYVAAAKGHVGCLHALLSGRGVDVNQCADNHRASPLCIAARNNRLECVRALCLAQDVRINHLAAAGGTALALAAAKGFVHVVRALLQTRGVDVNRAGGEALTPLGAAAAGGHTACVRALVQVRRRGNDEIQIHLARGHHAAGQLAPSPLHIASARGHADAAEALLTAGACRFLKCAPRRTTPVDVAQGDAVRAVFRRGVDYWLLRSHSRHSRAMQQVVLTITLIRSRLDSRGDDNASGSATVFRAQLAHLPPEMWLSCLGHLRSADFAEPAHAAS